MHNETHSAITPTGEEIKPGDVILDFRGDKWRYIGITRLPTGASTGRVYVEDFNFANMKSEFYPSVFDLSIDARNSN